MDIEHVALNVPDPVRMAAWYVEHLSLRVLRKQEQTPFTHFLADRAGRVVLELRPVGLEISETVRVTLPEDSLVSRLGTAAD